MNAQARSESMRGGELQTLLELGEGGMATAYLARSLGPGGFERLVVVKRLSVQLRDTEEAIERFVTEARVAAQLHHANIVGTQRIDWDKSGPFIVLDYVEGGTLDDVVEASAELGESLPVPVVLRMALDALHGLCFVHEAKDGSGKPLEILHRDISLQNVLVGVHDGIARISDFGVAKSAFSVARTEPGCFVGKLLYFSPEYLLGEPVGPTLDLYALGVTIWLALTGAAPWPGADEGRVARAIVSDGVPDLSEHVTVAPEVRAFVAKACNRDPLARYQSAREMAAALEHFDRHRGWVATHGEVARVVERLLGASLRERREKIARLAPGLAATDTEKLALSLRRTELDPASHTRRLAPPEATSTTPATTSTTPATTSTTPATTSTTPTTTSTTPATTSTTPATTSTTPATTGASLAWRFAPIGLGLALVTALGAALLGPESAPPPAPLHPIVADAAKSPPLPVIPVPVAPVPAAPLALPLPMPEASSTTALPAPPSPAPRATVARPPSTPSPPRTRPAPPKRPQEAAASATPDGGLRRRNPYR